MITTDSATFSALHHLYTALAAALLLIAGTPTSASAQVPAPSQNKPIALVGGTIHTVSNGVIENGTIVFEYGVITALGTDVVIPDGAEAVDVSGRHIYPGLVHAYSAIGLAEIGGVDATEDITEIGRINPNVRADVAFNAASRHIGTARSSGILTAVSTPIGWSWIPSEVLIPGLASAMVLDGWTWEEMTMKSGVALHVRWPALRSESDYWLSQWFRDVQGESTSAADEDAYQEVIQELRAVFADARAYRQARTAMRRGEAARHDSDPRWEAMIPVLDGEVPVVAEVDEVREIQDAITWAEEEGVRLILLGGTDAHFVAHQLAEKEIPVLLTWLLAPPFRDWEGYDTRYTLATRLHEAGVRFAIAGESTAQYASRLPQHAMGAAAFGLPEEEALRAVTLSPAQIMGIDDRVGSLEVGKDATLLITTGNPLEYATTIEQAYIQGRKIDMMDVNRQFFERYRERQQQRRSAVPCGAFGIVQFLSFC